MSCDFFWATFCNNPSALPPKKCCFCAKKDSLMWSARKKKFHSLTTALYSTKQAATALLRAASLFRGEACLPITHKPNSIMFDFLTITTHICLQFILHISASFRSLAKKKNQHFFGGFLACFRKKNPKKHRTAAPTNPPFTLS